ncbi:uncharacterized protein JCM6883_002467 [Sporobolomyces salmoneus]|uniref:uncharacterized protein n=1 Tax=Sporobolomyces salmoneus TaxID=183962 RepID=UPI0031763B2B
MVKVTSSLLVGAALFASSSTTLAAPTRFKRSTADVQASTDLLDGGNADESELVDEVATALGLDGQTGAVDQLIADNLAKRDARRTGSDAIRRGLPLAPESASDLAKRESVVAKLGLTGALAPLGVGPLIPTVQGLVDGLPVVGGPVGGLVKTVDTTVGLTDLLNKPKSKRQLLDGLLGSTSAAAGSATGGLGLGGLTGLTGGLTQGLPGLGSLGGLTGSLDAGSSTINGLLGQLQGAGASSSQLAGVLGQLQGLGLGNLPLSALTTATQTQAASVAADPSPANVQKATSILQGLTVAEAEKYGLLPSGTTGQLLTQIEAAAAAQEANTNNLASSFTARTYGFKAQAGSNETTSTEGEEDQGGATPTFSIASPEAVASAINAGGASSMNSTVSASTEPSSTSAAEMSKRTMIPSSVSASSSSSMTPAATASGKPSSTSDSMEDSGSDYSDDGESDEEDSDMEEEPVTPTASSSSLARRGGPLEDGMEEDNKKHHHAEMEGQGPNASEGSWHATGSSSMAQTQSQAVATAEAMTYTYSDASATAVPTTAPSKRSFADLD